MLIAARAGSRICGHPLGPLLSSASRPRSLKNKVFSRADLVHLGEQGTRQDEQAIEVRARACPCLCPASPAVRTGESPPRPPRPLQRYVLEVEHGHFPGAAL